MCQLTWDRSVRQLIEVTWSIWKLSADQLIVLIDRDQCSISFFLASLEAQENWYCTHIGHQYCDQLTAAKTGYPLTSITWPYRGLRCRPIEVKYLSADKLLVFRWSQAHVQLFKNSYQICCVYVRTIKILISNWPRTRKFSQLLQASKIVPFDSAHHGHALVTPYVQFLRECLCKSGPVDFPWDTDLVHFLCVVRHSCTYTKTTIRLIRSLYFSEFYGN